MTGLPSLPLLFSLVLNFLIAKSVAKLQSRAAVRRWLVCPPSAISPDCWMLCLWLWVTDRASAPLPCLKFLGGFLLTRTKHPSSSVFSSSGVSWQPDPLVALEKGPVRVFMVGPPRCITEAFGGDRRHRWLSSDRRNHCSKTKKGCLHLSFLFSVSNGTEY